MLLVDGDGPRLEPAGDLWGLSAAEAEERLRERLGQGLARRLDRPGRRAAGAVRDDLARRPSRRPRRPRRGAGRRSCSRPSPCAAGDQGRSRRPAGRARRRARPARALVRPGDREVPRARHAGQPARVQRDRARCRRATSRRRRSPRRRGSAAEELAERARRRAQQLRLVRDRLRAHLQAGRRQADAHGVRERLRARADVRGLRPRRRPRSERPLRRAGSRHHLGRRHDRLGDGVRRARPDRRAVAALRRRRRAAAGARRDRRPARASARCWRRARGAAAEVVGQGSAAFAPHVKGLELPGYEPRTLQAMALGFAVNARGADHNRTGAYEADLSGRHDRLPAAPRTSPPRSRPRTARRSWTR